MTPVEYKGRTYRSARACALAHGRDYRRVKGRLQAGWKLADAMDTPKLSDAERIKRSGWKERGI